MISINVFAKTRIAIIDTGINNDPDLAKYLCEDGALDLTGDGSFDVNGHGTNIAGIITSGLNPKDYCIVPLKFWSNKEDAKVSNKAYLEAMRYVYLDKSVKYLNLSLNGTKPYKLEEAMLKFITDRGTTVVTSAGNQGLNLDLRCESFPACYSRLLNFFVVGTNADYSNYGSVVKYKHQGSNVCYKDICRTGTSQATAMFMNMLLKGRK